MKNILLGILLLGGFAYGEELGAEDKEILNDYEFFSNFELLDEEVSLDDIEVLDDLQTDSTDRGLNQ